MIRRPLGAAVLALLLAAGSAQAQLSFVFGQNGTEVTAVEATAGSAFSLQVYLKSVNDTRFDTRDLFSVGVRVDTPGGAVAAAPTITPNTTANGGPFNSFNTTDQGGPSVTTAPLQVFADGASLAPFAATDRILIGTFTYTAGNTPGTYTITAKDMNPTQADTLAETDLFGTNLIAVDPIVTTDLTLTITPVPEPAGMLAVAGLAALGVARRRQAGRRSAAACR